MASFTTTVRGDIVDQYRFCSAPKPPSVSNPMQYESTRISGTSCMATCTPWRLRAQVAVHVNRKLFGEFACCLRYKFVKSLHCNEVHLYGASRHHAVGTTALAVAWGSNRCTENSTGLACLVCQVLVVCFAAQCMRTWDNSPAERAAPSPRR